MLRCADVMEMSGRGIKLLTKALPHSKVSGGNFNYLESTVSGVSWQRTHVSLCKRHHLLPRPQHS